MSEKGFHRTPEAVVEMYGDMVYKIALSQMKNKEDAEDVFQEVFLNYMNCKKDFLSEEHEKAYFLRAACNESLNMKKSLWNRNRVDFDDLPVSLTAVEDEEPAEAGEILRDLPARYRDVLYLYYYEELSAAEVAKTLGRNESTVRTQLQKGRERLRKLLTEGEKI